LESELEQLKSVVRELVASCEMFGCMGWVFDEMRQFTAEARQKARTLVGNIYPPCDGCGNEDTGYIKCQHSNRNLCCGCYP
jgi:hypothetical protein